VFFDNFTTAVDFLTLTSYLAILSITFYKSFDQIHKHHCLIFTLDGIASISTAIKRTNTSLFESKLLIGFDLLSQCPPIAVLLFA